MSTSGLFDRLKRGVFIIAEIGCNFEGDLKRAKEMIREAARAGADAVKFQTFLAEKITTKTARKFWDIKGCPGETQYEEFKAMPRLTLGEYRELNREAGRSGIIFFSSPEDEGSADLLEKVGVQLYKISSMNITHFPLLRHVAMKKKPIIMSTGASTIKEIKEAVTVIRQAGNDDIAILHCISNYPTKDEHVNLRMISHLRRVFPNMPVGYSDHTLPDNGGAILSAAVALGATIIEKHFTFDKRRPGYDHAISADYEDLGSIVAGIRRLENALGRDDKKPIASEAKARVHARRSLVAAIDISKGARITREMIDIKRPGTGIEPRALDKVIGKMAKKKILEDSVLKWGMVS